MEGDVINKPKKKKKNHKTIATHAKLSINSIRILDHLTKISKNIYNSTLFYCNIYFIIISRN